MARIAAGEQHAMKTVFERYREIVFGVAFLKIRDRDAAMDVVSDVMVGIWRNAATFKGGDSAKSWVLAITFHKIKDARRAAHRRNEAARTSDVGKPATFLPDRELTRTERRELQECLERLAKKSPEQREAIHLCFYEELSAPEIAGRLAMKQETVRTRLFYARQSLKDCLLSKGIQV